MILRGARLLFVVVVAGAAMTAVFAIVDAERAGDVDAEVLRSVVAAPSTTSTTTTVAPTTTTAPPPPRSFTVAVTGDIIPHDPVTDRARRNAGGEGFDFGPMFDRVRDGLSAADLALCHLETPLSADGSRVEGYPTFSAPPQLAAAIAGAGFDGCSAASNHSFDQGARGVLDTVAVFDALGLGIAGVADGMFRDHTPTIYPVEVGDGRTVAVAHVSFTYGLNGFDLPSDTSWMVDVIDAADILGEAAQARAEGAEVVIVSLHWGVEYVRDPTENQVSLAAELMASADVDVVVGHHAHVVQPVGQHAGKYVVYGLGNFVSNQSASCCPAATQDGVIVELDLTEDRTSGRFAVSGVRFVPTWVDRETYTVVPVVEALTDPELPDAVRSALEASLERTTATVTSGAVVGPDAAR